MTQEAGGTKNNNNGGVLGGRGGGATGGQVLKKGPWTTAEDTVLMEYVKKHGEGNWNAVQRNSGLMRCGKSCRLRWANHLRPNLKKGAFTPEEERQIIELHSKLGNKWARMALHLHGRTDNEIKNYWNTRLKRRQRAGLPIYPLEVQQNHQKPNSSSSLHQNRNYNYSPTIFNTFTFTTPSAQYQPPDNSHIKLFRDTGGCVALSLSSSSNLPFSTPSSPVAPYNYNQVLPPLNFNMNHLPMVAGGSSFNGVALPHNELSSIQSPLEAITQASSTNTESDYVIPASSEADNYEIAPELYSRGNNNGLLGDVIGESQALMRSDYKYSDHEKASSNDHKGKLEKRIQDWELAEDPNAIDVESIFKAADSNTTTENHLEDSSSAHSSLEKNGVNSKVAADEFEEMNFLMDDDLSTLLDFPIPTPLSDCYAANGNGTESSSFGKSSSSSSSSSDHHNVMINCINFGTPKNEPRSEVSCSAAVVKGAPVAANHDLNQGSCCWNNMPGFC